MNPEPAPVSIPTPKALFLEADPEVRQILTAAAERVGFHTGWRAEAEEADAYCRLEHPQLIILNWNLCGANRVDFCRQLRTAGEDGFPLLAVLAEQECFGEAADSGADYLFEPRQVPASGAWLLVAFRRIRETLQQPCLLELESANRQLEDAIAMANGLAMEAQQAYIELYQIFQAAPGGILLVNRQFRLLRYNETFLQMAECREEEVLDKKCYEILPSSLCHTPGCPLARIRDGQKRVQVEIARLFQGREVHYLVTGLPFRAPEGDLIGAVLFYSDITHRVEMEEALKKSEHRYMELSIIDDLTRLSNKRHFNAQLGAEIARAGRYTHPLSLLLLDIDDFKRHNDVYGHTEGDKVLARLGTLLRRQVRQGDTACRYGGEEFVVILPESEGAEALQVAERIREIFAAEPFRPAAGEEVRKTISVGVAQYQPGEKAEQLIKRADRNLYSAKQKGKNRSVLA